MDRIKKALRKLSPKERTLLRQIMERIINGDFSDMDVKKLKAADDVYRVRKGTMRVIFRQRTDKGFDILAVERRSDITYSRF